MERMSWERLLNVETLASREPDPQDFEKYPMSSLEKDYKAIISSAAFRRLQDKTQVQKKLCGLLPDNLKADYINAKTEDEYHNLYLRFLMVTDFVSGMTDSYAKNLYHELNAY